MPNVDDRIVKMTFDNAQFEQGVATTLNTLDKLEGALNLDGAAEGLNAVSDSVNNFSMDPVSNSVSEVQAKFSAFNAFVTGVFINLGSKAADFATNLAKKATVQPLIDGFKEYELQMKSIQTIISNTGRDANSADDIREVNEALDELNEYADQTIYNFSEMTRNIGTFTAAGLDLETSVSSIQGIANLAAVSGSSSEQASRAMYQLSQALSTGSLKLQDWNSVVNAGMGGKVFQNALLRTAEATARANGESVAFYESIKNGQMSFRESLQEGWVTSEILSDTLTQLTMTTEGLTEAEIQQGIELMKSKGYTEDEAKAIFDLANNAQEAATKVRTWSQLWETVGEALGSGWSKTWQLLVGDFKEATELFTFLSERISMIVDSSSEARNALLEDWLSAESGGRADLVSGIMELVDNIIGFFYPIKDAFQSVFTITSDGLKEWTLRFKEFATNARLSDAGVNAMYSGFRALFSVIKSGTQVASTLGGMVVRVAGYFATLLAPVIEFVEIGIANFSEGIVSLTESFNELLKNSEVGDAFTGFVSSIANMVKALQDFVISSAPVQAAISLITSAFSALTSVLHDDGKDNKNPIVDFVVSMLASLTSFVNAVTALDFDAALNSLESMFSGLRRFATAAAGGISTSLRTFGKSFKDYFSPFLNSLMENEKVGPILKSLASAVEPFKTKITDFGEKFKAEAQKFVEGNNLLTSIQSIGKSFADRIGPDFLATLTSLKDGIVERFTAIGNYFRNLTPESLLGDISSVLANVSATITNSFPSLEPILNTVTTAITNFFSRLTEGASSFGDVGSNLFKPLLDAFGNMPKTFSDLFTKIKDTFKYGISAITNEAGELDPGNISSNVGNIGETLANLIGGFIDGLLSLPEILSDKFMGAIEMFSDWIKNFPVEQLGIIKNVLGGLVLVNLATSIHDIGTTIKNFGKGIIDFPKNLGGALARFGEGWNAWKKETKADAILKIAIAMGALAASLFIIASLPADDLIRAGQAMGIIAGAVAAIVIIFGVLDKLGAVNLAAMSAAGQALQGFGIAILGMAAAAAVLSLVPLNSLMKGVAAVSVLTVAAGVFARGVGGQGGALIRASVGMVIFAGALGLMVPVVRSLGELGDNIGPLERGIVALTIILAGLTIFGAFGAAGIGSLLTGIGMLGVGFLAFSAGLVVFAGAIVLLSQVAPMLSSVMEVLETAAAGLVLFAIAAAIAAEANPVQFAASILIISAAMTVLAIALNLLAGINWDEMTLGFYLVAGGMLGLVAAFTLIAAFGQQGILQELAIALLAFSGALVVLSAVLYALTQFDVGAADQAILRIVELLALLWALSVGSSELDLVATATGLVIFAGAVGAMALALALMGAIPVPAITQGLIGMAAALAIIGVAASLISAPLAALGVGVLSIGAGMLLGAAAVALFTGTMQGLFDLGGIIEGFANSISTFGQGVAETLGGLPELASRGIQGLKDFFTGDSLSSIGKAGASLFNSGFGSMTGDLATTSQGYIDTLLGNMDVPDLFGEAGLGDFTSFSDQFGLPMDGTILDTESFMSTLGQTLDQNGLFQTSGASSMLGYISGVDSKSEGTYQAVNKQANRMEARLDETNKKTPGKGTTFVQGFIDGIMSLFGVPADTAGRMAQNAVNATNKDASPEGQNVSNTYSSGINSLANTVATTAAGVAKGAKSSLAVSASHEGSGTGSSYASGISSAYYSVTNAASSLRNAASSNMQFNAYWIGANAGQGLADGLNSKYWEVSSAAGSLASAAARNARMRLEVKSPSRVMRRIGAFAGEGLALGLLDEEDRVAKASTGLADAVLNTASSIGNLAFDTFDAALSPSYSPSVTPVITMGDLQAQVATLNDAVNLESSLNAPDPFGLSRLEDINVTNQDVVSEIRSLREDLQVYSELARNSAIVMDSGQLVGAISDRVDSALGFNTILLNRGVRG